MLERHIAIARDGDICPGGDGKLRMVNGVEIGHIFNIHHLLNAHKY